MTAFQIVLAVLMVGGLVLAVFGFTEQEKQDAKEGKSGQGVFVLLWATLGLVAVGAIIASMAGYDRNREHHPSKLDSMSQEELTRAREQEKEDLANTLRQIDEHRENTLWKEERVRKGY